MKKSERLKLAYRTGRPRVKIKFKCFILAHILTLFFVVVPASSAGKPIASAAGNIFDSSLGKIYDKPFSKLIEFLNDKKNELEKYDGDLLSAKAFQGNNDSNYADEFNPSISLFLANVLGSVKDTMRNVFDSAKSFVFPGGNQNGFEYQSSTSEEVAQEIETLKQQYAESISEAGALRQKFNFLQSEIGKIKAGGIIVKEPIIEQRVVEKTIERIVPGQAGASELSQNETTTLLYVNELNSKISEIRSELNNLNANLTNQINNLSSNTSRQTSAAFSAISLTNKIDSLSGTRLSSITVSGVSGLTDSDIPDTITASSYLPLSGGTLTGALTGTTLSLSGQLTVSGDTTLDSMLVNFASSTAPSLTLNYLKSATSTIPSNTNYAWSIATSTTALPIFSISTLGSGASVNATTTINGGLNLDRGAILYDYSSGITTINSLEAGPMNFDDNAGIVSWMNLGITSVSVVNTVNSYTAQIDSNPVLTIYGESDGSGTAKNLRVGIGTTTPLNSLTIHNATTTADANLGFTATSTGLASFYNWTMGIDISDGGKFKISSSTVLGTNDRLVIDGSGNFGVGTSSPWRTFSVSGAASLSGLTTSVGTGSLCLSSSNEITYNAADTCLSSLRSTKHNIENLTVSGLDAINALEPVSFVYNEGYGDDRIRYGFIAEDAASVDSRFASYNGAAMSGIDDRAILSVAVKAIKELNLNIQNIASTAATTTAVSQSFADSFFSNLFARVRGWLADAANGIESLFAKEVRTGKLCLDDVCVTKTELQTLLLQNISVVGSSASSFSVSSLTQSSSSSVSSGSSSQAGQSESSSSSSSVQSSSAQSASSSLEAVSSGSSSLETSSSGEASLPAGEAGSSSSSATSESSSSQSSISSETSSQSSQAESSSESSQSSASSENGN